MNSVGIDIHKRYRICAAQNERDIMIEATAAKEAA
jgi:hypothetical protein